jgi:hypothetical protein
MRSKNFKINRQKMGLSQIWIINFSFLWSNLFDQGKSGLLKPAQNSRF